MLMQRLFQCTRIEQAIRPRGRQQWTRQPTSPGEEQPGVRRLLQPPSLFGFDKSFCALEHIKDPFRNEPTTDLRPTRQTGENLDCRLRGHLVGWHSAATAHGYATLPNPGLVEIAVEEVVHRSFI